MTEETHSEQRTNREISNSNLKPFEPGKSGNPGGRPKDYISEIIRRKLLEKNVAGKPKAEIVADALIELTSDPKMRGFVPAIKELLDRMEGRVPDTHKIESDVPINIVYKQVGDREDTKEE